MGSTAKSFWKYDTDKAEALVSQIWDHHKNPFTADQS